MGRRLGTTLLAAGVLACVLAGISSTRVPAGAVTPGCGADAELVTVVVGQVACQEVTSDLLGDGIGVPFEYYVPPACDPINGVKCPTLYLLHGFGGGLTSMLGQAGTNSSPWIQAQTKRPPAGFESTPWRYADPKTWGTAADIPMILVAPMGQTQPGGYGPQPGLDSYWADWNPRYAAGGDQQRYNTPPPRFESFILDELAPFVERNLPAGKGRDYRAIGGVSLGGYGSYKNGLQHPDEWTSMLSVSGAHTFLFAPSPQPGAVTLPAGVQPPVPVTFTPLPPASGAAAGAPLPSQVGTFITAVTALGDPAADNAYFRGNMPTDLAMNARAYNADGSQAFGINGFVNDMTPAQTLDGDPSAASSDIGSTPFENVVFPMNVDMEAAFTGQNVERTFAIHRGNHSDRYRNAWYRGLEEFAYARLRHPDSTGPKADPPKVFDYRSINNDFSIWDWEFHVERQPVEFLTLRSVSCSSITLQGTGVVTFVVPKSCMNGSEESRTFTVDLGNAQPVSDPAALGATPVYGKTVTVNLAR